VGKAAAWASSCCMQWHEAAAHTSCDTAQICRGYSYSYHPPSQQLHRHVWSAACSWSAAILGSRVLSQPVVC
jgi:hypothetical protein